LDRVLDVKNIDEMEIRKIGKSVKGFGKRATSSEMEQPTPNGKLGVTAVRRVGGMGVAEGGVGRRAVEEDIAALSARYLRDIREDGNFSRTGRRKLPTPRTTARVSGTDGRALDTRISREPENGEPSGRFLFHGPSLVLCFAHQTCY